MADYNVGIRIDSDGNAANNIGDVGNGLDDLIGKAGQLGPALGAAGIGGALIGVGAVAVNTSLEIDEAGNRIDARLGLMGESAGRFNDELTDIFAQNYGRDFEDIGQALSTVGQQFQRLNENVSDEAIEQATINAFRLRDAYETDVNESVGAAVTLMENFGLTSDQAFDFIATGFQRGLNSSGDFLDSIGEYSNLFADGGADAGEFFSTLESGLQGGVLGTDRAADAFKEFGIRFGEGGTAATEALQALGLDTEALFEQYRDGELTVADAFNLALQKLAEVEDPILRNQIGVALIGTQYEDLGATAFEQLDLTQTKLGDVAGATEALDQQYDGLRNNWQTASREMQLALGDVGDELTAIGAEIIPAVTGAINTVLVPALGNASRAISGVRSFIDDPFGVTAEDAAAATIYANQLLNPFANVLSPAINAIVNVTNPTDAGPVVEAMSAAGTPPQ